MSSIMGHRRRRLSLAWFALALVPLALIAFALLASSVRFGW